MTATLDAIRTDDMNYPHHLLAGGETALVVFCAAFRGNQDAVWIADAGLKATCVDADDLLLQVMRPFYPADWEFVCADAYEFAKTNARKWDVVSLDPWTGQFDRCADLLPEWCRLARDAVIIGTGTDTLIEAPAGWLVTDVRKRTDYDGGVYWTTLEPE